MSHVMGPASRRACPALAAPTLAHDTAPRTIDDRAPPHRPPNRPPRAAPAARARRRNTAAHTAAPEPPRHLATACPALAAAPALAHATARRAVGDHLPSRPVHSAAQSARRQRRARAAALHAVHGSALKPCAPRSIASAPPVPTAAPALAHATTHRALGDRLPYCPVHSTAQSAQRQRKERPQLHTTRQHTSHPSPPPPAPLSAPRRHPRRHHPA